MIPSIERRLNALEGPIKSYRSLEEMPTAALEAMLTPVFGGRVPTDEELRTFITTDDKAKG